MKIHPLDEALKLSLSGDFKGSHELLSSMDQSDPRVMFNMAWHEMRMGNLLKGMDMINAGRLINVFGLPIIPGKIWKDEPLEGKTLLFRCEGGFGDQILNFRFAFDFKEMGANVLISCAKQLMPLFSKHGFICMDNGYVHGVHYDYWVPAMSAAYVLGYEYENLSGSPYLNHTEVKELYSRIPSNLKVGLRWSGSPEFEHEQFRRFDSNLMLGLTDIEGCTFYSLQRDENTIDGLPFADMREQMKTWEDTASIINGLDLVITSCTSIAHMSASLGKETWVVVPILPYYVWSVPGNKSPWYDSVTIFRQEKFGDWTHPFINIRESLTQKIKDRSCNTVT